MGNIAQLYLRETCMETLFITTSNGEHSGRASNYHRAKDNADSLCVNQNARAEEMGIKTRYSVLEYTGEAKKQEIRA
jgi:hypothetical protein